MQRSQIINSIIFVDTEIEPTTHKILDIGGIKPDGASFHSSSMAGFIEYVKDAQFIGGHNIINHDLKYIKQAVGDAAIIDTLPLSPLLFPKKPYHALLKDDKLNTEDRNNPLNDSKKARDLFFDEVSAFQQIDKALQCIFFLLLQDKKEFSAFFDFIEYRCSEDAVEPIIHKRFASDICQHVDLKNIIAEYSIELSYCLALINTKSHYSITPRWVSKKYPDVDRIMSLLRNTPCLSGCDYCNQALDVHRGLQRFFNYDSYKSYDGESLQEKAVKAAVDNQSIIAIFPTGGGKSITFQVPALMSGESVRGLTVVISPLQALMKDQVDNLEKVGISNVATINGLLDPIERAKSIERVEDGSVSILYISPESLRSKTITALLLGRNVVRFVIDEAHCFSAWGHDFRVDYLYIADFIRTLQEKKNNQTEIAISCFTATAKLEVIEDIKNYFKKKLSLPLVVISASVKRENLRYRVLPKNDDEEKYDAIRDLLEEKNCPTIIYTSSTKKSEHLAERLEKDGFQARSYHGKMDRRDRNQNQNEFINDSIQIIVATSAFGMGVDKNNIGLVIHHEISDSLENYVQEAGRAGRDSDMVADCFVLFNDEDINQHFTRLNRTKLGIKEIQQVWVAIKSVTQWRSTVSKSALEIARAAGWDDGIDDVETRVRAAIAALEDADYLRRTQNSPRVFADGILLENAQQAIDKINASDKFADKQVAIRVVRKLFSSKSKMILDEEEVESRVDYIADHLGLPIEVVINAVNTLREEKILADSKDLTVLMKGGSSTLLKRVNSFRQIEKFLLSVLEEEEKIFNVKALNEQGEEQGCKDITLDKIKTILNFWSIKKWIKRQNLGKNHAVILCNEDKCLIAEKLEKCHAISQFIIDFLLAKGSVDTLSDEAGQELLVISVHALKLAYENNSDYFKFNISIEDVENTLFYLSKIKVIDIEGGFLVVYNRLTIERLETDNRIKYKGSDYQKLKQFYNSKIQQIHIVGEYAIRMIEHYKEALEFVEDYFRLEAISFLQKYFKGSRQDDIKRNITPAEFRKIFGELSLTQLSIINNDQSKHIVIVAGPGSGKTKILTHKLASLILMEDVKTEQLLMLTFSRAAVTEFRERLRGLIKNVEWFIEIKTFHSYCFDLLGRVGKLHESETVVAAAVKAIKDDQIEISKVTKTVLVIDEAQDMDATEFSLVELLMRKNEDMRVIAVGDDDQNIYEFRGSSSKHLKQLMEQAESTNYELVENYRSKNNLVSFTNQFVTGISNRLKVTPIMAQQKDNGQIKLVRHRSSYLVHPLVNDIVGAELVGTTSVLTTTNEDALQLMHLLLKHRVPARLIQSHQSFNLYNLVEIRFFFDRLAIGDSKVIQDEVWRSAQRDLKSMFDTSSTIDVCNRIIRDFKIHYPQRKYLSDLEHFIQESKLENFYQASGGFILVSTIHKTKGKEFDNVFLLLNNFGISQDEKKRQLYVAMTRAKRNLTIHTNKRYLDNIMTEGLEKSDDEQLYPASNELVKHLTHRDLFLSYFERNQETVSALKSGDSLTTDGVTCFDSSGRPIAKFSKEFLATIDSLQRKNYTIKKIRVGFMLYWKGRDAADEIKIVLPEVYFEK